MALFSPPAAPPVPAPPSCSQCQTVTQSAQPGAPPQQSASQMFRASNGQMRIDMPNTSIITNPLTQQATVLDHLKLTAQVVPMVKAPAVPGMQMPGMPAAPAMPAMPAMPAVQAQSLGKALIEGHEVEGMKYTMPAAPAVPGMPAPPAAPAAPGMPAAPAAPKVPPVPTVAEVWSSTKLQVPVLTKVTGSFGQQTTYCKPAASAEPPPSTFQIPPGYTQLPPPQPPAPPAMPAAPAAPKPPVFGR